MGSVSVRSDEGAGGDVEVRIRRRPRWCLRPCVVPAGRHVRHELWARTRARRRAGQGASRDRHRPRRPVHALGSTRRDRAGPEGACAAHVLDDVGRRVPKPISPVRIRVRRRRHQFVPDDELLPHRSERGTTGRVGVCGSLGAQRGAQDRRVPRPDRACAATVLGRAGPAPDAPDRSGDPRAD